MYKNNTAARPATNSGSFSAKSRYIAILLWVLFGAGIALQAFSPHWEIRNRAFVIPMQTSQHRIDVVALIERERHLQLLSGLLVLIAGAGLAVYYRAQVGRAFGWSRQEEVSTPERRIERSLSE